MVALVAGWLGAITMMGAALWYCPLLLRRRITPAPAGWIIGSFAMSLSVVSYHSIPGRTIVENATLYAAAVEILLITLCALGVLYADGKLRVAFDPTQKICLAASLLTFVLWMFFREFSNATFWTTQVLLSTAYIAFVGQVLPRKSAFDSLGNWGLIWLASVIGMIPAIMMKSPYGIGNSIRAIVSAGILLGILIVFDKRSGWAQLKDEVEVVPLFYRAALSSLWRRVRGLAW